jgi:hypothetical protein
MQNVRSWRYLLWSVATLVSSYSLAMRNPLMPLALQWPRLILRKGHSEAPFEKKQKSEILTLVENGVPL